MPEVRFKGFSEGWENFTLNSMVKRVKSYSLSRDVETSKNTGFQYIHYGDIHKKVANIIDLKSNLPNIQPGNYELLKTGDLILADASEDYQGIATPAIVYEDLPYKLVAGLHTIALRPESKRVDSLFLYYLINSQVFRKHGYRVGSGMKVFGISATNILKFEYVYPTIVEQTQIGNFFKQLDETIAFQQQELDILKQTKQGFLQKMFPKEGEFLPQIRFSGFSGEWEERNFFDNINSIFDFRGRTPKKLGLDWSKSGYLALSALNVKNGYIDLNVDAYYGDEELYKKWMGDKILKQGQVLFTTEAPMGNVAQVPDNKGYILSQRTIAFEVDDAKITNDFLSILLRSPTVINQLYSMSSGGTAKGVSQKSLSKLKIVVPKSLEEQTQIASFFKQLDETIALHEQELNILKQTKKAFLQKMFV